MKKLAIPEILFEDNHLLVVVKPSGMLVQGDKTGDLCLLDIMKDYLKEKYNKPGNVFLGCVHRLDRPVSGIIIMARTSKALTRLNESFKKGLVEKYYLAKVEGRVLIQKENLEDYLIKDSQKNISKVVDKKTSGSKFCQLSVEPFEKTKNAQIVKVELGTGRSHQIRVQLSSHGLRIEGDVKYGGRTIKNQNSICLHAYYLEIEHPVLRKNIQFSKLPIWL